MATRIRFCPALEQLDARIVPALFGNPWPSANLTLSFAPDGTDVNGAPSQSAHAFAGISADMWQQEILRAFQTWAAVSNVNIGVVADGGQAFGTPGAPQGDLRFGDIRIGAVSLDANAAALAAPFDLNAGTRSGDVWFNSSLPFSVGGSVGNDIFTVALHEAGHVLGIPESADPTSAMFDQALVRLGISAADATAIQSLYGIRQPDAFDAKGDNGTLKTASSVQVGSGPGSSAVADISADITTLSDADVYVFQPSNLRGLGLTATVRVAGYSLLVPRLEILDASGNVIASGVGSAPGAGDVTIHLDGLTSGATYYARVTGARADVFGIGGYKLELRPDAASPGGSGGSQLLNPDAGTNDTIGTATQLGQQFLSGVGSRVAYSLSASLNTSTDVDFYRLKSPQTSGNVPVTMTVSVWTTPPSGTDPIAQVYDARGQLVASRVLVHDGGAFTLQIDGATSNADYYVAVRHAHPGPAAVPGNYFLSIDFGAPSVQLTNYAAASLTANAPVVVGRFTVNEEQVLHLVFDASQNPASATSGARLFVVDASGRIVDTRFVLAGDVVSLNLSLRPGEYRFLVGGGTTDGSAFGTLQFALRGLPLSDPIGPQPITACATPAGTPPPPAGGTPPPPVVWPSDTVPAPITTASPPWWIAPPTDWTTSNLASFGDLLGALP